MELVTNDYLQCFDFWKCTSICFKIIFTLIDIDTRKGELNLYIQVEVYKRQHKSCSVRNRGEISITYWYTNYFKEKCFTDSLENKIINTSRVKYKLAQIKEFMQGKVNSGSGSLKP